MPQYSRKRKSTSSGPARFAVCFLVAAALVSLCGLAQTKSKTATLIGFLGDTSCGMKHTLSPGKRCNEGSSGDESDPCTMRNMVSAAKKCVAFCTKTGANFALVVGPKVYVLDGKQVDMEKFAGEKVTVSGTVQGNTLKVGSIRSTKVEEAPDMD